jgi:hypothetical protein
LLSSERGELHIPKPASKECILPEAGTPINLPPVDIEWLKKAVAELFSHNRLTRPHLSGPDLIYHAPSLGSFPGRYPHQWFWDSCAHAIALSHIDIDLARKEVLSLVAAQDERGFIPHMVFNPYRMHPFDHLVVKLHPVFSHSPYLQPPLLAQAVSAVQAREPSKQFLDSVLPGLKSYYRFIGSTRERGGDGLVEIIHSFESGKDRSPEYDSVYGHRLGLGLRALPMWFLMLRHRLMRWDMERIFRSNAFRVKDLLFNCTYADNLSVLAQLCREAGEAGESDFFAAVAARTEQGVLSRMHDPASGVFYSLDARRDADRQIKVNTVSTFLPLLLNSINRSQVDRLVDHLANEGEYWTAYPVPAEPLGCTEADWTRTGLWRGLQTWVILNWLICRGLLKQAHRFPDGSVRYGKLAKQLTGRTYGMVRANGFREYYHSLTGKGSRATDFGMSALVLDMVISLDQIRET